MVYLFRYHNHMPDATHVQDENEWAVDSRATLVDMALYVLVSSCDLIDFLVSHSDVVTSEHDFTFDLYIRCGGRTILEANYNRTHKEKHNPIFFCRQHF